MAEALVVHPDADHRAEWMAMLASRGLEPTGCTTAAKAAWLIEERRFGLVLVGWAPTPDRHGTTTRELLRALYRCHRDATTVVCDEAISDPKVASVIHEAHPNALTHDARLGHGSLGARIDKLMGRSIGDLRLDRGVVVHDATGDVFAHPIASRFLLAHPGGIEVSRQGAEVVAVHRLRQWLAKRHSCVQIVAQRGTRVYRMTVGVRTPSVAVAPQEVAA
jgi:hypothetical protein